MNKNVSKNSNRVLYGKVLPTLFIIALPLFLNYLLELVYNVFDTFALSSTGIGDAGSVVLLSQIKSLLSSTGTALISGAAILMTSYLGRQDKQKARMVITQILYMKC
jgi:Na+-driven multidrug efflux pump